MAQEIQLINGGIWRGTLGGAKYEIEVIVSHENWIDSDAGFDVDSSVKSCKEIFPGKKVDPNEGDHRYQCKDPKYEYIANLPALQYSCVLEKRLQYRLLNVEKNKALSALREKIASHPNNTKLKDNYNNKLEDIRGNVNTAISNQKKEIERLKDKAEKVLTKISKICKV